MPKIYKGGNYVLVEKNGIDTPFPIVDIDYLENDNAFYLFTKDRKEIIASIDKSNSADWDDSGSNAYSETTLREFFEKNTSQLNTSQTLFDFNPINLWWADNLDISGTTTTAEDQGVGTSYDMYNPGASNQPTYQASHSNLNDQKALIFDGSNNYLTLATDDYGAGQTSGAIFFVMATTETTKCYPLSIDASGSYHFKIVLNSGVIQVDVFDLDFFNSFRGSTIVNDGSPFVGAIICTGTEYKMMINGVLETITTTANALPGAWFSEFTTFDTISIARLQAGNAYAAIEWGLTAQFPYTNDADMVAISDILIKKYIG